MTDSKVSIKDRLDYESIQNQLAHQRTDMSTSRTEMAQERTEMAQERTEMAQERTEMAQYRTELAIERTALSNSQTFLAYFRSAIAAFAAGIGMFEFISQPFIVEIGIAFMAVAPVVLVIGIVHFFMVRKKINRWQHEELHGDGSKDKSDDKSNE